MAVISKLDMKYTFRQLTRKPGFVLLAILVLAGGLGLSLMSFTISYSMTYKTLPMPNGERIVHVCTRAKTNNCGPFNAFEFAQIRSQIKSLENIGIYTIRNNVPVTYENVPASSDVIYTEPNLFALTGSTALLGRTLEPFDLAADAQPVVVVGYDYWQQYLGGATDVVGKFLRIASEPARIVGVMPEGYSMPWADQLWMPVPQGFLQPLQGSLLPINTFALLKDGVSMQEADAEIHNLVAGLREQYPYDAARQPTADPLRLYTSINVGGIDRVNTGHVNVFPLSEFGRIGSAIIIFLINIFTVLIFLLACINAGTLLLARTNERLRDISIRVALGAPRWRLFIQSLGENVVIVVCGGLLALLLAGIGLELVSLIFNSLSGQILAFWMQFHLDASTLAGALLFIALTILLTGGIPIWRLINGNFNAAMRDGTRGALGLRAGRMNRALVITSISIVTVLMAVIAVAMSFVYPETRSWRSVPDNTLFAQFRLDAGQYDLQRQQQFRQAVAEQLIADPAVAYVLVGTGFGNARVQVETAVDIDAESGITAQILAAGPNNPLPEDVSFDASDVPTLREGRYLNEFDQVDSPSVAVISQALADTLWPGASALGKRVRIMGVPAVAETWREVVGVYSTSRERNSRLFNTRAETVTLPFTQVSNAGLTTQVTMFAQSAEQVESAKVAAARVIAGLDADLAVQFADIGQMLGGLSRSVGIGTNLALAMGLFTFLVAIAGIYGLAQNAVQMATQEIGTRRALGATDKSVGRTFLRRGTRQLLTGFVVALLIGLPFLYIVNTIAASLGLSMAAPLLVMIVVLVLLYCTILLAILLPIRRILRLEPAEALRYE
jgi:putative ABC transport system permease protein